MRIPPYTGAAHERLRERFFVCKDLRSLQSIADECVPTISPRTLARFCRGGYVSAKALRAIEAWVAGKEIHPPSQR